jgi:hypothetical protein
MEDGDDLQLLRIWAIDHDEAGKSSYSQESNRQRCYIASFGAEHRMPCKTFARRQDS